MFVPFRCPCSEKNIKKIEKDKVDGTERVAVKKFKPLTQAAASAPTTNTDDFDDELPWEKN